MIHRDLKPPNILWYDCINDVDLKKKYRGYKGFKKDKMIGVNGVQKEEAVIKITDFNHAIENEKLIECNWKGNCGTHWFKAPE